MKHGTLGHRGSDKPGLSEHTGVLDREAPTSKRQRRWWEYVTEKDQEEIIPGIRGNKFAEEEEKNEIGESDLPF